MRLLLILVGAAGLIGASIALMAHSVSKVDERRRRHERDEAKSKRDIDDFDLNTGEFRR